MAKFTAIPAVPSSGVPDWEVQTLSAIKANIELLLGLINPTCHLKRYLSGLLI